MSDPAQTARLDQQVAMCNEILDAQIELVRTMLRTAGGDTTQVLTAVAGIFDQENPQQVSTMAATALIRLARVPRADR